MISCLLDTQNEIVEELNQDPVTKFHPLVGISARDTSDPSKRPVPVPWDTFMQAVDVAKDVAAEREAAHHGLLLALGDWRPDWCIQNQRREPTESVRAIDSTVFHDGICKQHDSSPLKISAHHCRVGLLQCRKDFSNLSEAIVHAAIVPLLCGEKVNRF